MVIARDAVSYHDSLASTWDAAYDGDTYAIRMRVLASLIPPGSSGQRWLDAGCGTGTLSRWLARERGFSVVAIDVSEQMLANAAPQNGVEYRKADVAETGLPSGTFDGVLSSSVLEYLTSVEAALREFHRLLKPGGTLLSSVPNAARSVRIPVKAVYWLTKPLGRKRWHANLDYLKHCYTAAGFRRVLEASGFSTERVVKFGYFEMPFGVRMPTAALLMAMARKTTT
jgi:2-polyprenyl-3-methyl-5-hydroxy-6-metoxy-1,4-benzoquinol methylase